MDKNKIINKIKVFLGIVKEKFESLTLQNGGVVTLESLEINREVYDAEGNPLTAGEYILEDGTKFTVDENGVIKEIERPDGEETKEEVVTEEMAEEPVEEPVEEPTKPSLEDRVDALEAENTQLKQQMDEMYEILLAITEKLQAGETKVEETIEEFKKFKAQPSATPLHFNKEQEDTPKRRIDVLKQFKNNQ